MPLDKVIQIKKLIKKDLRGRICILGPTGSGKSYTGGKWARIFAGDKRVLVIDSERRSFAKYADILNPDDKFDVIELDEETGFSPQVYTQAIQMTWGEDSEYGAILCDSLSHAWIGVDGALDQVDKAAMRSRSGSNFNAWRDVTPAHMEMIQTILDPRTPHFIGTMRVKMSYEMVKGSDGKTAPQKIGLQPVQRDGFEYEFDMVCDMDTDHNLMVGKTRCAKIDGLTQKNPDDKIARIILEWLGEGAGNTDEVVATKSISTEAKAGAIEQTRPAGDRTAIDDPVKKRAVDELTKRGWLKSEHKSALDAFKQICAQGTEPWNVVFNAAVDEEVSDDWDAFHSFALGRVNKPKATVMDGDPADPKAGETTQTQTSLQASLPTGTTLMVDLGDGRFEIKIPNEISLQGSEAVNAFVNEQITSRGRDPKDALLSIVGQDPQPNDSTISTSNSQPLTDSTGQSTTPLTSTTQPESDSKSQETSSHPTKDSAVSTTSTTTNTTVGSSRSAVVAGLDLASKWPHHSKLKTPATEEQLLDIQNRATERKVAAKDIPVLSGAIATQLGISAGTKGHADLVVAFLNLSSDEQLLSMFDPFEEKKEQPPLIDDETTPVDHKDAYWKLAEKLGWPTFETGQLNCMVGMKAVLSRKIESESDLTPIDYVSLYRHAKQVEGGHMPEPPAYGTWRSQQQGA